MQRLLTFLTTGLLALQTWGQADLFICTGYEAYQLERRNLPQIQFQDSLMVVGLNGCFHISNIDSIVFSEPFVFALHDVGWFGDVANGRACYWPQYGTVNFFPGYSVDFSARPHFEMTAYSGNLLQLKYFLEFNDETTAHKFHNGVFTETDRERVKYMKSTLTRRRKYEIMLATPYYPCELIGCNVVYDYTGLMEAQPSSTIQAIVYAWTCPDAPDIMEYLPNEVLFGSFNNGHYTAPHGLYTTGFGDIDVECSIDLICNDDSTMVMGDVMTLTFKPAAEAAVFYDALDFGNDKETTVELNGNRVIITEHFEQTMEECMHDLVLFDIDWIRPMEVVGPSYIQE